MTSIVYDFIFISINPTQSMCCCLFGLRLSVVIFGTIGCMHHKMNDDDEQVVKTYEARRVCQVLNCND